MEKSKLGRNPLENKKKIRTPILENPEMRTEYIPRPRPEFKIQVDWAEFIEEAIYPGLAKVSQFLLKKFPK